MFFVALMCFILQVCAPQYYFQCNGTNSAKRMVGVCYKANVNSMGTPMTELPSPCFNRFGSLIIWTYCMRIRDFQVLFSKLFLFRYSNGKSEPMHLYYYTIPAQQSVT